MTLDEKKCTKDPRTCGYWREREEYVNVYPDDKRTRKVMKCVAAEDDIPMLIVEGRDAWKCPFNRTKGENT